MVTINTYSSYEAAYPFTVILRKEGNFYHTRNDSAKVIHALFDYSGWQSKNGHPLVGFTINNLDEVCQKLNELSINNIVIVDDNIIQKNLFEDNNFFKYFNTSIDDLPIQESKNTTNKQQPLLSEQEINLKNISVTYLQRMLSNNHPVYNTPLDENQVVTNDNVKKCFEFIIDILNRVEDVNIPIQGKVKNPSTITFKNEYKKTIDKMIVDYDIRITELVNIIQNNINELINETAYIKVSQISNWLLDNEYLMPTNDEKGKVHRIATNKGTTIGINNITINDDRLSYTAYVFTPNAQKFIYEHLPEIGIYKKKI